MPNEKPVITMDRTTYEQIRAAERNFDFGSPEVPEDSFPLDLEMSIEQQQQTDADADSTSLPIEGAVSLHAFVRSSAWADIREKGLRYIKDEESLSANAAEAGALRHLDRAIGAKMILQIFAEALAESESRIDKATSEEKLRGASIIKRGPAPVQTVAAKEPVPSAVTDLLVPDVRGAMASATDRSVAEHNARVQRSRKEGQQMLNAVNDDATRE